MNDQDAAFCAKCDYHTLIRGQVACGYLQATGQRRGHRGGPGCPRFVPSSGRRRATVKMHPNAVIYLRSLGPIRLLADRCGIPPRTMYHYLLIGRITPPVAETIRTQLRVDVFADHAIPPAAVKRKGLPGCRRCSWDVNQEAVARIREQHSIYEMAAAAGVTYNGVYMAIRIGRMSTRMANAIRDTFGIDPIHRSEETHGQDLPLDGGD